MKYLLILSLLLLSSCASQPVYVAPSVPDLPDLYDVAPVYEGKVYWGIAEQRY